MQAVVILLKSPRKSRFECLVYNIKLREDQHKSVPQGFCTECWAQTHAMEIAMQENVNCKHYITKLMASGCRLAFFLGRTFIGGFRRQNGYYSHISTSVKKLAKVQHSCLISFWVYSIRKIFKSHLTSK